MPPVVAEPDTIEVTDLEELFNQFLSCTFISSEHVHCTHQAEWEFVTLCCNQHFCTEHKDSTAEYFEHVRRNRTRLRCLTHEKTIDPVVLEIRKL